MSVPLDRLYHFLHDHCNHDVIIYHFYPHGSKKPENIVGLSEDLDDVLKTFTQPVVLFHDQEPLSFSNWTEVPMGYKIPGHPYSKFKMKVGSYNVYDKLILVHSELNSNDVQQFDQDGVIPVYYWSHAIIARDWFRYAEHDTRLGKKNSQKKFLIYNRAWKGSREYRLKFAELLVNHGLQQDCITSFSPLDGDEHYTQHNFINEKFKVLCTNLEQYFPANTAPSWASADYNAVDYQHTDIEVILETLFDDNKLHITEKTLRALAVGQPFILCATPGCLEYLRSYGFETFDQCWDESYDNIQDPCERLTAIVELMKSVRNSDLSLAQEIALRNQQHFFSQQFWNTVIKEFKDNFQQAVKDIQKFQSGAYFLRAYENRTHLSRQVSLEIYEHVKMIASEKQ